MESINKSFNEWRQSDLKKYLGLIRQENFTLLQNWLVNNIQLEERERFFLEDLRQEAREIISYWNEQELRQRFITPLTRFIKFYNPEKQINFFAERKLAKTVKNSIAVINLQGVVDWCVATGLEVPEHPFFFIHEYKAEEHKSLDGRAQLLAAMFVAQELNKTPPKPDLFNPAPKHFYKDIPIYGAYVIGRLWFFVVLKDKTYSISDAFDSTNEQGLQAIFKALKAQKQLIYSYLE